MRLNWMSSATLLTNRKDPFSAAVTFLLSFSILTDQSLEGDFLYQCQQVKTYSYLVSF